MQYEVTIKMLVRSPVGVDKDRLIRQTESVCEFGTVMEAIADGLHLERNPRLLNVEARSTCSGQGLGGIRTCTTSGLRLPGEQEGMGAKERQP